VGTALTLWGFASLGRVILEIFSKEIKVAELKPFESK
jgi:hypothetical protein